MKAAPAAERPAAALPHPKAVPVRPKPRYIAGMILGIGSDPVSYTHLDVYKRQGEDKAAQSDARNLLSGAIANSTS